MKTQTKKLVLKKKTILELNNIQMYTIHGGGNTISTLQTVSRTPTSSICAGVFPTDM